MATRCRGNKVPWQQGAVATRSRGNKEPGVINHQGPSPFLVLVMGAAFNGYDPGVQASFRVDAAGVAPAEARGVPSPSAG